MTDDLFSYLDVSGPEFAYLGHFREARFLCAGHNDGADPSYFAEFNRGPKPRDMDQPTVPGFRVSQDTSARAFTPYDPNSIGPTLQAGDR